MKPTFGEGEGNRRRPLEAGGGAELTSGMIGTHAMVGSRVVALLLLSMRSKGFFWNFWRRIDTYPHVEILHGPKAVQLG